MTEIEALEAQKKEIEKKIRELKKKRYESGDAFLRHIHYGTSRKDEWCLSMKTFYDIEEECFAGNRTVSMCVINDKSKMPDFIDKLVDNLKTIKEEILADV
jgi:hypothetical protein